MKFAVVAQLSESRSSALLSAVLSAAPPMKHSSDVLKLHVRLGSLGLTSLRNAEVKPWPSGAVAAAQCSAPAPSMQGHVHQSEAELQDMLGLDRDADCNLACLCVRSAGAAQVMQLRGIPPVK